MSSNSISRSTRWLQKNKPVHAEVDSAARPSADDFLSIIRQQQLGKLKIYLGASPGVGKTYAMLNEGRRLKQRGVDVVIGYVEPHDRPETTAQIGDLEIVPPRRRQIITRSRSREMDVDAVIARKPTVALVDELAHTNAPDSKNRKRYEDMEDLLRAGINVISTVNIQHLESLYNIVEQATGVRVKERVPDEVVAQGRPDRDRRSSRGRSAGAVAGRENLSEGTIQAAMANFFSQKNLTRLREMTLTRDAQIFSIASNATPPEANRT